MRVAIVFGLGDVMRKVARFGILVVVMVAWMGVRAAGQGTSAAGAVTATGKLVKVMAIGGESTGWAIELESEQTFGGKPAHSIEVAGNVKKFGKLENKKVTANGTITHKQGVESGNRIVLQVEKIKEWKEQKPASEPKSNY